MTDLSDLSDDDIALLRREGCLADEEEAARATHLAPSALATKKAAAVLRAAGLEPGRPALHLLIAAIGRRGWGTMLIDGAKNGWRGCVFTGETRNQVGGSCRSFRGDAPDPATALALAFVAAVRASEGSAT